MALPKAVIEKLAKLAKLTPDELTKAINDEKEVDIAIDDKLAVFTEDELTARDTNNQTIGKKLGESEGETKGKELAVKAIKTKIGITDTTKEVDKVADLIQAKIGNDTALQDQIKLLQKDVSAKEQEVLTYKQQAEAASVDTELLSYLPQNRSKVFQTSEHLLLVKTNLEFTQEGVKDKTTGEILRDPTTKNALDKKTAIETFYTKRAGLLETQQQQQGGRGGTDTGGNGKAKNLGELRRQWQKDNPGVDPLHESFQMVVRKELKDNPDLVMEDDGA
jgi:hypothetical protein